MTSAPTTNIPVAIPAGTASGAPGTQAPRTIAGSLSGGIPGARGLASRLLHGTPGRMRLFGLLGVSPPCSSAPSAPTPCSRPRRPSSAPPTTPRRSYGSSRSTSTCSAPTPSPPTPSSSAASSPPTRALKYEQAPWLERRDQHRRGRRGPARRRQRARRPLRRVQAYAALVEQARSNNRLGLPVGAQYLTQASAGLRADAIPIVTQIVKANEDRAQKEFDRSNSSLQLLVGVVSLIGLVALAVWLAKRTHRYLNPLADGRDRAAPRGALRGRDQISGIGSGDPRRLQRRLPAGRRPRRRHDGRQRRPRQREPDPHPPRLRGVERGGVEGRPRPGRGRDAAAPRRQRRA